MSYDAIPLELRERRQWIVWRWEPHPEKPGERIKPPYPASSPGGSRRASNADSGDWTTIAQAAAVVEAGKADGIGIALTPDLGVVAVDLDEELAAADQAAIVSCLDSYTETSPSGTGMHVLVRADFNGNGRHPTGLGVFKEGRFFYFTGEHVRGTPTTIEERQAELDEVLERFLPPAAKCAPAHNSAQPVDLDDQELLDRAFAAKNGADFRDLWEGRWEGRYGSQSEADLALCSKLAFWLGRDAARMDEWFRRSGLMRDKWNRDDYRDGTIDAAIAGCDDVYTPQTRQPIPDPESVSESVGETASRPVREGGRTEPIPPIPPLGGIGCGMESVAAPSASLWQPIFQSATAFAGENEPNAEMVLGVDDDDAAMVAGGTVLIVGKGGAGKTTMALDIGCSLAAGREWQGLRVPKARRVAVAENDGPRGRFRRKVRAKLAAWTGDDPSDNLVFLAEPWAEMRLSREDHRAGLAAYINENEVDVLIAGPIVSLGMIGGGTPDEVAAFEAHLKALRDLLERPLLVILLHHTNQKGQVSGAWDRVPDTLMFVVNIGKGTRLKWQKARDSSTLHAATWKLRWADGMTFELDDTPDVTEADIEEAILDSVTANPGKSWTVVSKPVKGNAKAKADVRDRLIAEGRLVNRGKGQAFALWLPDDVEDDLFDEQPEDDQLDDDDATDPERAIGTCDCGRPIVRGTGNTATKCGVCAKAGIKYSDGGVS